MHRPSVYHWQLRPWHVVTAVTLLYLGAVLIANSGDPLVFVTLGTRYSEGNPAGTEGYDGQFTYFIAQDPFLHDPVRTPPRLDAPAYRYQRILLPLLARVMSIGSTALLPWTLLLTNGIALVGSTVLLERLLTSFRVSPWFALVYALYPGLLMAVRLSLSEPLAYGLIILAIWLLSTKRVWPAACALALAALARETALVFTAGIIVWEFSRRRWAQGLRLGLLATAPFVGWQLVLLSWFGTLGAGSGGAMATPFEVLPFNGFFRIYTDTGNARVFLALALLLVPAVVLPTLWGLWQSLSDLRHQRADLYTLLLAINALVIPFVPFSTFREPLGIMRFIIGLVIAIVLHAASRRNIRVLRYSTLWLTLLALAAASG